MSLRWRLTLWSTLILGVVFAVFGTVAYFTASDLLYGPINENLVQQSNSNLRYIAWSHLMRTQEGSPVKFRSVYFTIIDVDGQVSPQDPFIPVSDPLAQKGFNGEIAWGTVTGPDGERARVLVQPIYLFDVLSGKKVITGILQAATPLDIPDQILNRLSLFLVVASAILLVVAAVGSNIVAGRALRVVNKVTQKARQIETSQDLTQRIPEPGTDDEVGGLVKTFNQMLARLDVAFEAQRRFVADSSHELRTPLTVIKGNLHLMKRTTDPIERAELISITEAETSRLNRMVNDLLYMAQMQAGHDVKPVLRGVELDSLLLDVFALARSMAALKEQKVTLAHEDVAAVHGDRDQLQHLLLNLVDNAVKYTPPAGLITLGVWNDGGWARFEVTNTGQGIDGTDLPMLFERFFRTQEARKRERKGSGLGLAIAKSIVEAHGGRIEVFSQLGQGATFRVWLPIAGAARPSIIVEPEDASVKTRRVLTLPRRVISDG